VLVFAGENIGFEKLKFVGAKSGQVSSITGFGDFIKCGTDRFKLKSRAQKILLYPHFI